MDIDNRSTFFSGFWRFFAYLLGISIFYIGAVRPVQSRMMNHFVAPYFANRILADSQVAIDGVNVDQLDLIGPFKPVKVELPFNGWYWLTLGLLLTARNMRLIKIMSLYHLGLFLALFLGAHLIISGQYWLTILFNIHEHVYKVLFLILSLIGLKPVFVNQK
ncbi:hypothetical protein JYT44_01410 [Caldithrix abyssi]|nr:hypothetical protein [Caldithrix abyssi]